VLARYRRVLATPHVPSLVASSVLARMPIGITGLATVLFVQRQTGSFGSAGVVSAAFAVAAGAIAPLQGRLIDRLGQTRVLVPSVLVHVAGLAALIAFGLAGAPVGVLAACAVVAGAAVPPISAALRTLWPSLLDADAIPTAYALDSVLIEVFFVGGPLFTALIVTVFSPAVALGVAAGLVLSGTLWFCSLGPSRGWRGELAAPGWAGPLHAPGMRTLLGGAVGAGVSIGSIEVALPGFGAAHGHASLGGPLIAAWSLGSAAGGLVYGSRADRLVPHGRWWLLLNLGVTLAAFPLLLAGSPAAMFALAPLAGVMLAPMQATQNLVVGDVAPLGTLTEAYSWVLMGLVVGIAAGNAAAGLLIDASGWRAAIAVGAAVALVAAVWALARERTVSARPAAATPLG